MCVAGRSAVSLATRASYVKLPFMGNYTKPAVKKGDGRAILSTRATDVKQWLMECKSA